jgi:hypothetical protein
MSEAIEWTCLVCEVSLRILPERFPVHCRCGYTQLSATAGLGDITAATLHRSGLTKARYIAAKRWLGLVPKCGCQKRQQRLNELGRKVGIG